MKSAQQIQNKKQRRSEEQEKQYDSKQNKNKKDQKVNSIVFARQIVIGSEENIGKWLFDFKQIKNSNINKLTQRVLHNLTDNKLTFEESVIRFMAISDSANEQNTTGHQMNAILSGFHQHWLCIADSIDSLCQLINFTLDIYVHVSKKFITCCHQLINKFFKDKQDYFQNIARSILNNLLKSKKSEQNKILPLIHQFNLYETISYSGIVDLILRINNMNQIVYIFRANNKINMKLLNIFVDRCTYGNKSDLGKCQTVLRNLKVDPFQFNSYIVTMQKRYINYLMRTYRLFNIELIISYNRDLLMILIDELANQRRSRQLKYFVLKYKFQDQYHFQFKKGEKQQILNIKNILLDNDYFGPTQVDVLEQVSNEEQANRYLYMGDFQMGINHVTIVTTLNINDIDYEKQFDGIVGIDQERGGGTHVFDPSITSIIQLYNGQKVFIFDILQLKENKKLKTIMTHIFTKCQIYGQEIVKQITAMIKNMNLQIEEKVIQQLVKNRINDASKQFKRIFPKEKRSNLAYQCEFLLNRILSKYEQCSGWLCRPLRKAQIHYAALDCVLPVKICQELAKRDKPT